MRLVFFVFVTLFGCSTTSPTTTDAATDSPSEAASVTCATSADCPSGQMCFYAIADGCGATSGICASQNGSCKAGPACACDGGQTLAVCGPAGRAAEPVKSADLSTCPLDASAD